MQYLNRLNGYHVGDSGDDLKDEFDFRANRPDVVDDAENPHAERRGKQSRGGIGKRVRKLDIRGVSEGEYDREGSKYSDPAQRGHGNRVLLSSIVGDIKQARAIAYDLVYNGVEVGGGSLRIYRRDVQEKVFDAIGLSEEEAEEKFGYLMEAFQFGAPPHGGMAFGLDRLVMMLAGAKSIRDVIAFPKTATAQCLLTAAPGDVSDAQLEDLHIAKALKPEKAVE